MAAAQFCFDAHKALETVSNTFEDCQAQTQHLLGATSWTAEHREQALSLLATWVVDPVKTNVVLFVCRGIIVELVFRALQRVGFGNTLGTPAQTAPISCALSKILLHSPQTKSLIVKYVDQAPPLMLGAQIALAQRGPANLLPEEADHCLQLLQAAYRFLKVSVVEFREKWNWSVFFSLVSCSSKPVAHFAFRCMSLVLGLTDKETREHAVSESLKFDTDFVGQFDDEELHLALTLQQQTVHIGQSSVVPGATVTVADMEAPLVDICGHLVPVKQAESKLAPRAPVKEDFIPETSRINLAAVALAVCKGNPILLSGPTGSGKTHTILELAHRTNNNDLIKIHLGDQSDAKVLLGSYVCTDVPGEFRWVAGALTKAVTEGRWLVIEDIDLAPTDVLSVLIPLLQKRRLFIASRGEEIVAAPGFQLFATQTTSDSGSRSSSRGGASNAASLLLGGFWTRVHVEPLPYLELEQVLKFAFPQLGPLAPRFISTFQLLVALRDGDAAVLAALEGASAVPELLSLRVGRFVSTRDLMKWCRRVVGLIGDDATQETMHKHISSKIRELAFQEAVDCFCGAIRNDGLRDFVAKVIGRNWDMSDDRVMTILHQERPTLHETPSVFQVGRVALPLDAQAAQNKKDSGAIFAYTRMSLELMEKIAQCVSHQESVLLVGETGAGKTSTIQHLARKVGRNLVVLNMNQQSDSADLLGGFRPVELRLLCQPLKLSFEKLFCKTFSKTKNKSFLDRVEQAFAVQNWPALIALFWKAVQLAESKFAERDASEAASTTPGDSNSLPAKRRKLTEGQSGSPAVATPNPTVVEWNLFKSAVSKFETQHKQLRNAFAFSFVEGALVRAVQEGSWVLLDEINLASQETLESLSGLLDGDSIVLTERGDVEPVKRHPHFRLLACMNPATDVGKKDLPPALRSRFSEFVLREMSQAEDLQLLVSSYLRGLSPSPPVAEIVQFYLAARKEAEASLSDGANQRPHFSLRTLARALEYTRDTYQVFGNFERALLEGLATSFLTQLDSKSYLAMKALIKKFVQSKTQLTDKIMERAPRSPGDGYVQFEQYWLEMGPMDPFIDPHYILTPSIKLHLVDLARILTSRKYPVLIQGPTSAGKTSMIEFLARRTGHRFVRINNHEHTDIQEYIGQYVSDSQGRLIFQEGILVEAVRNGYWVVLDELNLAPSEVLEALNRLLDDNRELFIPETQQIVKPHPHFMLFATQNPPGLYGGRKNLSRAFRNRFIELHFDEIPDDELETILRERCYLPQSYCRQLIAIMKDLQRQRQGSQVFAGRQGLITLRDLFRWAERQPRDYQELAHHGYMLLADRLRDSNEQDVVKRVLEKHLRVTIDVEQLYETEFKRLVSELEMAHSALPQLVRRIVWTKSSKRLFALVYTCLRHREPVLLVGETGTGKTTVCQVLAELLGQQLHILNCHQHTETADFLGGLRPIRGKDVVNQRLRDTVANLFVSLAQAAGALSIDMANLPTSAQQIESLTTSDVILAFEEARNRLGAALQQTPVEKREGLARLKVGHLNTLIAATEKLVSDYKALFQWYDGPLVHAMRSGDIFLVDEISLAEDAVLERLNSILEPSRTLTLAEKGGANIEELYSHPDFRILATMNPGGDFGKKELSPALRNRFTEVWVPAIDSRADLKQIIEERFANAQLSTLSDTILNFIEFFNSKQYGATKNAFSLRDILSWVDFIKMSYTKLGSAFVALIHGAHMILLDGLGITHPLSSEILKRDCLDFLMKAVPSAEEQVLVDKIALLDRVVTDTENMKRVGIEWTDSTSHFGIGPFVIEKANAITAHHKAHYTFRAPTTSSNLVRLLRGLQLSKPILLEGSPGVGKTTLVEALGALCGRRVVRINLSEQTDMLDLLGADLPQEDDFESSSAEPSFAWRDGIFLDALKAGDWVLLDEMNLANQSVLEGLNAVLDHRGSVFIPELNRTFECPPSFRIFACQNPTQQGGGRKGLPKSFLNRFTKVYLDKFTSKDLEFVASTIFPTLPHEVISSMIRFNQELAVETMEKFLYARQGSPWEFNLRDVIRWCQLVVENTGTLPGDVVDMLYLQRLRTVEDRKHVLNLYNRVFGEPLIVENRPYYAVDPSRFQVGSAVLPRAIAIDGASVVDSRLDLLHAHLSPLESLMRCIRMNWLPILIGGAASGKNSIVQLLADLCGHELHTFSLNSSVDTIELLGGFEQVDLNRHREELVTELRQYVYTVLREVFVRNQADADAAQLAQLLLTFTTSMQQISVEQQQQLTAFSEEQERLGLAVLGLSESIDAKYRNPTASSHAAELISRLKRIQSMNARSSTGCFEWADGILIKAMKRGDWILMDNVNLCSNSVLDRLLPLLEPHGYLSLNERGIINGEIPKIVPHPNFRIFFAMDPKNGEISRAMRNRGIELVLLQPHDGGEVADHVRLLLARGFNQKDAELLANVHHDLALKLNQKSVDPDESHLNLRDLLTWAELTLELVQRGHTGPAARRVALEQIYCRRARRSSDLRNEIFSVLDSREYMQSELVTAESGSAWISLPADSLRKAEAAGLRVLTGSQANMTSPLFILRVASVCLGRLGTRNWNHFFEAASRQLTFLSMQQMDSLALFTTLITALQNNAGLRHIREERENESAPHPLQQWLLASQNSVLHSATDIGLNEPLLNHLKRIGVSLPEQHLIDRLPLMMSYSIIVTLESVAADPVRQDGVSVAEQSPFQQAVAFSLGKIDSRSLIHPLVALIPNILETFDSILLNWINDKTREMSDDQIAKLSILLTWRLLWSLHCQASRHHFNPVLLILLLRWATRQIRKLDSDLTAKLQTSLSTILDRAQHAVWQSTQPLGGDSAAWLFWKRAGHPLVLGKKDLSEIAVSFRPVLRKLEFDFDSKTVRNVSESTKLTIIDALSTLYWAQIAGDEKLPQRDAVLEVLHQLPEKILADENFGAAVVSSSSHLSSVSRIQESNSIMQERVLIGRLARELALSRHTEVVHLSNEAISEITSFLDAFGSVLSSRSPSDFVAYKVLLWMSDPEYSGAVERNAFVGLIQEVLMRHLMRPSRSLLSVSELDGGELALSRLELAHREQLLFSLVSGWSAVSVAGREDMLTRIKDAVSLLSASVSASSALESDWNMIAALLADTVLCLEIPMESHANVLALCKTITTLQNPVDLVGLRAILGHSTLSRQCVEHALNVGDALNFYMGAENKNCLNCWRRRGDALASLGYLRSLLLLPAEPIDPCMKKQVLFEALTDILTQLSEQESINLRDEANTTGRTSNLRIQQVRRAMELTTDLQRHAEAGVVRRPTSVPMETFRSMFDEIHGLFASGGLCSSDRLTNIVASLKRVDILRNEGLQTLMEEASWQSTVTQFLESWLRKYPDFVDVSGPLIVSTRLIQRGLRISRVCAELQAEVPVGSASATLFESCLHMHNVSDVLLTLLPSESIHEVASSIDNIVLSPVTSAALTALVKVKPTDIGSNGQQVIEVLRLHSSLLRCCLQKLVHVGMIQHRPAPSIMSSLGKIFEKFSETYKKMKAEDAEREREEAATFKYKTKTADIETKEEFDEKVYKQDFPNYFAEFNEIVGDIPAADPDTEVGGPAPESTEDNEAPPAQTSTLAASGVTYRFTDEESYTVCRAHLLLYSFWNGEGMARYRSVSADEHTLLFEQCYNVVSDIHSLLSDRAPAPISNAVLDVAHAIRMRRISKDANTLPDTSVPAKAQLGASFLWESPKLPMNFYTEPNPAEVNLLLAPVSNAQQRIQALLAEPEIGQNEVLLMLNRILQRLLDLGLHRPLMQFMTGAEVFLRKAQDWELYQPARYSMKHELDSVLRVVSRWRRLELEYWPRLLEQKRQQVVARSAHWWFYLYGVINASTEPLEEVQKTLQTFMETSSYGEFQPRLDMLLAFYNQLVCQLRSETLSTEDERVDKLKNMLFHLFKYYEQFIPHLEQEMAELQKPLEEKLRDFIKISRWDDASVYRLEKSAETSHRQLSKFSKQYEEKVLKLSIQTLLNRLNGNAASTRDSTATASLLELEPSSFASAPELVPRYRQIETLFRNMSPQTFEDEISQSGTIFARFRSIAQKKIINKYLRLQHSASESIGDLSLAIIQNSHEIRARPADFNGVQKRRALLTLFDHLQRMGMDYHTTTFDRDQLHLTFLMQEPVPPRQVAQHRLLAPDVASSIQQLWSRGDSYFYRDVAKVLTLRGAQTEHNRALSTAELRKISGFAEHILQLLRTQRSTMSSLQQLFSEVVSFVEMGDQELSLLSAESIIAPTQQDAIKALHTRVQTFVDSITNQLASVETQSFNLTENPAVAAECSNAIAGVSNRLRNLSHQLGGIKLSTTVPWSALVNISKCIESLETISADADAAVAKILPEGIYAPWSSFVSSELADLTSTVESLSTKHDPNGLCANHLREVRVLSSKVVRELQIGVQQLVAEMEKATAPPQEEDQDKMDVDKPEASAQPNAESQQPEQNSAPAEKNEQEAKEDAEPPIEVPDVEDKIVARSHSAARSFASFARAPSILKDLREFQMYCASIVNDDGESPSTKTQVLIESSVCLSALTPLLHQYATMLGAAMAGLVEHYQALGKLEYVLTSVFIGLCREGYCGNSEQGGESTPEEGETLTGVEGTGLGEGQGEKDVSDKYEDEDQILGEKRDEEMEQDKDGEKPPVDPDTGVEMENDFEGDVRDVASKEEDSNAEEPEDEDQKEPDREMGDLDPNKEDVVDEKLWEESDEEEDQEKQDKPDEKYEKNAPAPKDEKGKKETEMAAKPEDEAANAGDDNAEEEDAQPEDAEDGAEEFPEEQEGSQGEEEINDDNEDKYEDNHHKQPHGEDEEVELPEDLNLDGGEEDKEEEKGEGASGEEEENPGELPPESEKPEEFPEQPAEEEGDQNQKDEAGEDQAHEENQEEQQPKPEGDVVDAMDVSEEESPEKPEEEEKPDIDAQLNAQQQDAMDAYGIQDDIGLPQQQIRNKNDDAEQTQQDADMQMNEDEQQAQATDVETTKNDSSATAAGPASTKQQQQDKRPKDPNPFRSLSETLEHWKKRLNVVEDVAEKKDGEPEQDRQPNDDKMDEDQQYEYVRDEEMAQSETLGAATEDQADKMDLHDGMFQQEEKADEEDKRQPQPPNNESKEDEDGAQKERKSSAKEAKPPTQQDAMDDDTAADEPREAQEKKEDALKPEVEGEEEKQAAFNEIVSSGIQQLTLEEQVDPVTLERKLSQQQLLDMRQQLEIELAQWRSSSDNMALGMEIWRQLSAIVSAGAQHLCEQLRLVLEPTQKAKLQGDYRTGKRINMRRVITYVASQFRKDKIWLRRTQPNKRNYQVLLAIDDTQSVRLSGASGLLREAVATIAIAMQRLQVGQIALAKFGNTVDLLHTFSQPFTDEAAAHAIPRLTFDQTSTNMEELLRVSIQMLEHSRDMDGATDTMQLMLVIGDGRFGDKRGSMKQWLHKAQEQNIFVVFIVVDADPKESILDIQSISYPKGQLVMKPYIDEFPFSFYLLLKNITSLSAVLGDALRQWIEMVAK